MLNGEGKLVLEDLKEGEEELTEEEEDFQAFVSSDHDIGSAEEQEEEEVTEKED